MKQPNFLSHFKSGLQPADKNRLAFQGGSYSLMVTAVVLAILILVNVLVSALPASLTAMTSAPPSSIRSPAIPRWS